MLRCSNKSGGKSNCIIYVYICKGLLVLFVFVTIYQAKNVSINEPKTEQRQRAGIRPSLGQPFSHQGNQGAKWKFFSDVTSIYDVRWGCPSLDNTTSQL